MRFKNHFVYMSIHKQFLNIWYASFHRRVQLSHATGLCQWKNSHFSKWLTLNATKKIKVNQNLLCIKYKSELYGTKLNFLM